MLKKIGIVIVVIAVVVGGVLLFKSMRYTPSAVSSPSTSETAAGTPSGTAFADLPDASAAFKVYPGSLTSEAKTALIGWDINTTMNADGSATITLTPNRASDQMKSYTVPAGDGLYFVEKSRGDDDQDSNTDNNLQDDYGIIVDANGLVVQ
jgi:hypothetical protein